MLDAGSSKPEKPKKHLMIWEKFLEVTRAVEAIEALAHDVVSEPSAPPRQIEEPSSLAHALDALPNELSGLADRIFTVRNQLRAALF